MAVWMPLGVAGLITPWNFPMAISAWKGMAALVCRNTVVIKPASASLTPLSVIMLTEAFEEAGLPEGVWNVVTGGGREVGEPMLKHPKVRVVSFTGSTEVGCDISIACAARSSRDGWQERDHGDGGPRTSTSPSTARSGAHSGRPGSTAASRLVVHEKVYNRFVEQLVGRAKSLRVDMYTGIVYVNAPTISAEVHPLFGGVKKMGNGDREEGVAGIDVFTEWKSIYVDYSGNLQSAQIDTEL